MTYFCIHDKKDIYSAPVVAPQTANSYKASKMNHRE